MPLSFQDDQEIRLGIGSIVRVFIKNEFDRAYNFSDDLARDKDVYAPKVYNDDDCVFNTQKQVKQFLTQYIINF